MRVVYLLCGAEEIYHTHDLLHCSGGKYTNRYNTNEEEPTIYCTTSMNANHYTREEIYHPQYSVLNWRKMR
jgi:hypothetical protein